MMKPFHEAIPGRNPLPDCVLSRPMVGNPADERGACPDEAARSETIDFGRAVEHEIPRLRRYARALTHDLERAEDLVQHCLMHALAKQHLWAPGTDLRAWLFTIMHNSRVNDVRRSMREEARSPIAMIFMTAAPRHPDARLELRDLDRAISELPEAQRVVVLLVGLEEMSYEQTAEVLGVPLGTVRSRLARARAELRERLHRRSMPKGTRSVERGTANCERRVPGSSLERNSSLPPHD
jgi:RNA polymerase sigma-70 factor, ECF subfamily